MVLINKKLIKGDRVRLLRSKRVVEVFTPGRDYEVTSSVGDTCLVFGDVIIGFGFNLVDDNGKNNYSSTGHYSPDEWELVNNDK